MGNLREEFNRLAQTLASAAEERKQFINKNKRETEQMRLQNRREQAQVAREIARQAQNISNVLETSTNRMRRQVQRMLSQNRNLRHRSASEQSIERRQVVSRIRRHVMNSLDRHKSDRARNARQQLRIAATTRQTIKRRVAEIRNQSMRLTTGVANDLYAGRQALAAARRGVSYSYRPSLRPLPAKTTTNTDVSMTV